MYLFLQTLTGRKVNFNFEEEDTVWETWLRFLPLRRTSCLCIWLVCVIVQVLAVKNALQEKEGISVTQIRLIWKGKQLYVAVCTQWITMFLSLLTPVPAGVIRARSSPTRSLQGGCCIWFCLYVGDPCSRLSNFVHLYEPNNLFWIRIPPYVA